MFDVSKQNARHSRSEREIMPPPACEMHCADTFAVWGGIECIFAVGTPKR